LYDKDRIDDGSRSGSDHELKMLDRLPRTLSKFSYHSLSTN
jgi:hypothetical protein